MKQSEKREFVDFLSYNKVYDAFCLELFKQKKLRFDEYIIAYQGPPKDVIKDAFDWQGSKRYNGSKWQKLDAKWLKYLEE